MAGLTVSRVYQDPLLTNVSVRYSNKSLIAESVFPVVTVPKRTGVYFVYDKENLRVPQSTLRTEQSRAVSTSWNMTKANYGPLLEHALEIGLDIDDINEAQEPLDLRTDATLAVTEKMMLEKENALATYLSSTSNITNHSTPGTLWSAANSTPLEDVTTARSLMKAATVTPNTVVMGQKVWDALKNHAEITDRVKYSQFGQVTTDILCTLYEVTKVLVGDQVVNSGADGLTDSLGYVWGKNFWLMYVTDTPGIRQVSAGYHLTLENGRYIDRWEELERKAEFVRFNDYYSRQVIAQEAIYLFSGAVA